MLRRFSNRSAALSENAAAKAASQRSAVSRLNEIAGLPNAPVAFGWRGKPKPGGAARSAHASEEDSHKRAGEKSAGELL